jgi:hypothetical protein
VRRPSAHRRNTCVDRTPQPGGSFQAIQFAPTVATREQLRLEIQQERLVIRLVLTFGGAAIALVGSFMDWSHGLADTAGPVTEGGIAGDGRYTALLAVVVAGCTAWFVARPERRPAIAATVAAVVLFIVSVGEWTSVSDRVESANHDDLLFATASVAPGSWVVMLGAVLALIGAVWTLRVDR